MAEEIWCSNNVERLYTYVEQRNKQRAIFFDLVEKGIGYANCLKLHKRYIGEGMEEKGSNLQVCTVERWAYLPEDTKRRTSAEVVVSTYYLDIINGQLCISNSKRCWVWYNSNHINPNDWKFIGNDSVWPTPVPRVD
jgi:hypothetical protein